MKTLGLLTVLMALSLVFVPMLGCGGGDDDSGDDDSSSDGDSDGDGDSDSDSDSDTDADSDSDADGPCTDGDAQCDTEPWQWCVEGEWVLTDCVGDGSSIPYSPCNCDVSDPCNWVGDAYCDEGCYEITDTPFDDSADCG